jgi:hypothetical protein
MFFFSFYFVFIINFKGTKGHCYKLYLLNIILKVKLGSETQFWRHVRGYIAT